MERHRRVLEEAGYFKEMGRRLRETRKRRGLGRADLAKLTGLAANTIGEIERGLANPRLSTVVELAEALDVAVSKLVPPRPKLPRDTD